MAINWTGVEAFTRDIVLPNVFDQIFNSNPVFYLLDQKGVKEKSGKNIRVLTEYAKNLGAGSYSGLDVLPTTRNDKFGDTELSWKQAQCPIVIAGDEDFKNAGPEQIEDLVTNEVSNAKRTIQDILGTALYTDGTGNGSKDLTGFIAAIDAGSNVDTYAGISRATYTWWKSGYTNWAATPVSLGALQKVTGARTDGNIKPDYLFTHQDIYDKLYELVLPMQRQSNDGMARAGFDNIVVNGRTIVVDSHCGATDIWVVNSNFLKLISAKGRNFIMEAFQKPTNQDARVARILWAGNLVNESCRRHARIYGVDVTL
jgi:hypothetical protein